MTPEDVEHGSRSTYPNAERESITDVLHGVEVHDPYRWLEDPHDPRTQRWQAAQDELFAQTRQEWDTVDSWHQRLDRFMGAGSVGPPVWRGDRVFRMVRHPGQDHAVLHVIDEHGWRVLIDPNSLDPSGLSTLDSWQPSKEGNLLAYQLSVGGNEESNVYVMDVITGETVEGPIDRARYSSIGWLRGGDAYYYIRRLPPEELPAGEEQFHRRVWLHKVGSEPDDDVMIFGEHRRHTEYFGSGVSWDGRWLTISASEGTAPRNDLFVADLSSGSPESPDLQTVQAGQDAQTGIRFGRDGRVYVFTDLNAHRGRLATTLPGQWSSEHWVDLIAEDDEAVMTDYAILDDDELIAPILLVSWTRHAVAELTVHDLASGRQIGTVELPGIGSIGGLVERPEGGHEVWFMYTDSATVPRIMKWDAVAETLEVEAYPPGFVEVPPIEATMQTVTSRDGTQVQLILLLPRGSKAQREHEPLNLPTVLYGYGGFGVSMHPAYSASILAWVSSGGAYAIACLRGGSEEGEDWHRAGMLGNKQNVFDDFRSCAHWLIDNGWTTSDRLAISGGSNGGLLVGAVMTQEPDLMKAVHCSAPLLDMVRYEATGLGATWNVEYGSARMPDEFEWLWSYSPYHQVHPGVAYPTTLFTVFGHDTRVDPMHARKMCAALQHATTASLEQAPILLRSESDTGHGARSVSRSVELSSDVLAFFSASLGHAPRRT